MFQLYDGTRRRICLLAFLLFCLLPTTLVVAWGIARRTSWHVAEEANRLTSLCGLRVSLSAIRYVRPGEVVYEGLNLATQKPATRCCSALGWKPPGRRLPTRLAVRGRRSRSAHPNWKSPTIRS